MQKSHGRLSDDLRDPLDPEELPGKSRQGSSIQHALVKQRHTPGRGALSVPYTAITVTDGTTTLVLRKPCGTKFPRVSSSTS